MKPFLLSLFFVALTAPLLCAQQLAPQPPLVSTSGSALVRVVPDLADLSFEVEVRNTDLNLARKQQAERAKKVLAALRAAGVAETELQSSQVQIAPNFFDRRGETEQARFYVVSQTITATLHDVKKVPDVTTDAVLAGATSVGGVSLRTTQLRKHRDEARAMAIRAAREKATALTTELGVKVGKPYTITEGPDYGARTMLTNGNNIQQQVEGAADPGDGTTPTFAPGSINISASVNVSFLLE